jgi:hypothetical protein
MIRFFEARLEEGKNMQRHRMIAHTIRVVSALFAAILVLGPAIPASALEVQRSTLNDEFGFQDPAGTLCPFAVDLYLTSTTHEAEYSDSGTLLRIVDHIKQVTTLTNVDTSKSVSRIGTYTVTSYPGASSVTRGSFGRTFDEDGNLLFTDSGRVVYNENFDQVFVTPHTEGERVSQLLCAALS